MIGDVTKFEIEEFDGMNFTLWKMKVEDMLVQNDQALALKGVANKSSNMINEEWANLDKKVVFTIRFCLLDSVLFNVEE